MDLEDRRVEAGELRGVLRQVGAGVDPQPHVEEVAELGTALPDGLAFDAEGNLYVGCYEPSQVLRIGHDGRVATLFRDVTAHILAHPTNLAFRGTTMFTANLGRWHITAIEVGCAGLPLRPRAASA